MTNEFVLLVALAAFCNGCSATAPGPADLGGDMAVDKAAACTGTFGDALTAAFGRLDGTVVAIVKPSDQQCPQPNSDHIVLEVASGGAVYRMVVNVESTFAGVDPRVLFQERQAALVGPSWSDGWHTAIDFDYVGTLALQKTDFVAYDIDPLVSLVNDAVPLGMPVSVYATSSGGDSAHLVHRNLPNQDGAIVIDANTEMPTYLFFAFADSTF